MRAIRSSMLASPDNKDFCLWGPRVGPHNFCTLYMLYDYVILCNLVGSARVCFVVQALRRLRVLLVILKLFDDLTDPDNLKTYRQGPDKPLTLIAKSLSFRPCIHPAPKSPNPKPLNPKLLNPPKPSTLNS